MDVQRVLKRPILTEKTDFQRDDNQYVFEVDLQANKLQIKEAVEWIFDVRVESVNTMVIKPKWRRLGRKNVITRPGWKKAIVRLAPGERIMAFFEGI
ncbi:MAG: 50S ribosomal protein L23 [Anaerolineae bacterium]|jgi:large subunit ribosomal protein L23